MDALKTNAPHLVMAIIVIAAATVLSALHVITGGEAIGMIAAAGGFSLGTSGASASVSAANQTVATTSHLSSGTTPPTTTASPVPVPAAPATT